MLFKPSDRDKMVIASRLNDDSNFVFVDENNRCEYEWLGELKSVNSQAIIHRISTKLSRVATDGSEWLRNFSKRGRKRIH